MNVMQFPSLKHNKKEDLFKKHTQNHKGGKSFCTFKINVRTFGLIYFCVTQRYLQ